ncbi:DUF1311 domain-containing protein [Mycobacterium sp. KBS0706]|nr:DUF1311 domain-containing protein [Mycobacterium sp. KBS0706]
MMPRPRTDVLTFPLRLVSKAAMTMRSLLLAAAALLALSGPAFALDCGKASTTLERAICADKRLKTADTAMGQAYAQILKAAAGDAEIRDMLVASQRRWLAARDRRLAGPEEGEDDAAWHARLLKAMHDRSDALGLRSRTDPKQFDLIAAAEAQRRFAARFTGGPFAGFSTACDFLPADGRSASADIYGCFATRFYQNKDRVCGVAEDWASGSVSETHSVAEVVGGTLETVAACAIGGTGDLPLCPDQDQEAEAGWDLKPNVDAVAAAGSLPRIDAEGGGLDDDASWLRACLTDPGYPQEDPANDGTTKKP